ncbi:Uma2 family endonuclease [Streptomyces sp. NPDC088350]|uniref:Uma2 family endonuclease n=1 Tax=Streptomyces sp. NPDC088350 TaxID=3365854 RepID=UPI00380E8EA1
MTERAVYHRLRDLRERFTPPPGVTYPEISDGMFLMTMSPCRRHQVAAADLRDQLAPQVPVGVGVFEASDTGDEVLGRLRIPDLVVATGEATMPLLAVEVVSPSNPRTDYEDKSRDYPAMGIPRYLIVDPRDGTWTYQWEIGGRGGSPAYENRLRLPYGRTVTIATELGEWKIETGGLPLYSREDMMLPPE